jgi:hypothetical protein
MGVHSDWWKTVVGPLRRAMGFAPTPAELEAELDAIETEPFPEHKVREIVEAVMKCRLCDHCGEMVPWNEGRRWFTLDGDGWLWNICPKCKSEYNSRK